MRDTGVTSFARGGGPIDDGVEAFAQSTPEESIIDRFDAIVRRFSSRLAIQDTTGSLTYAELAALVASIAAATFAVTEGRSGPVALLLPAGATLPAAMLGVLAAGRAYVPLDTDFPVERNELIISEAGCCAVISSGDVAPVHFSHELPVIDIEDLPRAAPPTLRLRPRADDLAAICYTSGSSGRPKGVAWSHGTLLHWVRVFTEIAQLSCADRALLLFSANVSASFRSIYCSLLNGGSLHILPPLGLGLAALAQQIRARRITIYHSVPALMRRLADSLSAGERFDTVRVAYIGGDRVKWSDVDACRRSFSADVRVYMALSSTETGPCIHGFVDDALRTTAAYPPMGRPAPGWTVAIVDDEGVPVADGEPGEVVVSSGCIALGYWQGSNLQVRSFPIDPADPGLRMYKTGDLALRRRDGLIEFLGRKDQQIKLNGHRIELGEVESALLSFSGVRDAVAIVRRDASGVPYQLAAYCELEAGVVGLSARDLGAKLSKVLPLFMVPRSISILDTLPRLSNFKIDREELRRRDQLECERTLAAAASARGEPTNRIQETLLELWRDVLKRQDIGTDDDFFLCGGDSLAAVDLLYRIEQELQQQLPLTMLAAAPTVAQLADRLETMALGAINDMVRINTAGERRPLFAVHGAGGHASGLLPLLRSLGPDQPCYGLQPPGMDWTNAGCATLPQVATYYLSEVRAVQPHGPYRLLGVSFGGLVVFEMALQLQKLGEPVEFLAMVDTDPPTCLLDGRANRWRSREVVEAQARPADGIETLNASMIETHRRMQRDYVVDSPSEQNIFRGELTYFYCAGSPIVAGNDHGHIRRRLWQRFASRFRLLRLPGLHGAQHREPQCTALRNLLRACLDDKPPAGDDPARVFGGHYHMDNGRQPKSILSATGEVYHIEQDRVQGYVDEVRIDAETIRFIGWAVEPCRRQPAQTLAVFVDDQFLGCGSSYESRPDVARLLSAATAQYSGFDYCFPYRVVSGAIGKPRLFVLSNDGRAAELRYGVEPVTVGSVATLADTAPSRVILSGDWSRREPWGVWSDGRRAAVAFDASCLPERFAVAIEARFFPPGPLPEQKVRICDDAGYLLATISNEQPNGTFVAEINRPHYQPRKLTFLVFDVDTPISPRDLGTSGDSRKLGIGLSSLTFHALTSDIIVDGHVRHAVTKNSSAV